MTIAYDPDVVVPSQQPPDTLPFQIVFPLSPSVNRLYRSGGRGRRIKTEKTVAWFSEAELRLGTWQLLSKIPLTITVIVGLKRGRMLASDVDNRAKAVLDVMLGRNLDQYVYELIMRKVEATDSEWVAVSVDKYRPLSPTNAIAALSALKGG